MFFYILYLCLPFLLLFFNFFSPFFFFILFYFFYSPFMFSFAIRSCFPSSFLALLFLSSALVSLFSFFFCSLLCPLLSFHSSTISLFSIDIPSADSRDVGGRGLAEAHFWTRLWVNCSFIVIDSPSGVITSLVEKYLAGFLCICLRLESLAITST